LLQSICYKLSLAYVGLCQNDQIWSRRFKDKSKNVGLPPFSDHAVIAQIVLNASRWIEPLRLRFRTHPLWWRLMSTFCDEHGKINQCLIFL